MGLNELYVDEVPRVDNVLLVLEPYTEWKDGDREKMGTKLVDALTGRGVTVHSYVQPSITLDPEQDVLDAIERHAPAFILKAIHCFHYKPAAAVDKASLTYDFVLTTTEGDLVWKANITGSSLKKKLPSVMDPVAEGMAQAMAEHGLIDLAVQEGR